MRDIIGSFSRSLFVVVAVVYEHIKPKKIVEMTRFTFKILTVRHSLCRARWWSCGEGASYVVVPKLYLSIIPTARRPSKTTFQQCFRTRRWPPERYR